MSNDDNKTKTFFNPYEDYAIVQKFTTDDGLFDAESLEEHEYFKLLEAEGDYLPTDNEPGDGDA